MEFHKLLFYFSCLILFSGVEMAKISMKNNCQYTVWPGTLTSGNSQISKTGFELASQQTDSVDVPAPWTGRIFARTQCKDTNGKFTCATADCGPQVQCNGAGGAPPATLAEFTLAAPGGQDFYDVSLVDGFNLPLSITPEGGSGNNCTLASCGADVNKVCPANLQVNGDGGVVGCKSACVAFGEPRYCCTQDFDKPETCKPTNYSMIFKEQCPQAYSYAYDDLTSTFSCMGGPNYLVTFCP